VLVHVHPVRTRAVRHRVRARARRGAGARDGAGGTPVFCSRGGPVRWGKRNPHLMASLMYT